MNELDLFEPFHRRRKFFHRLFDDFLPETSSFDLPEKCFARMPLIDVLDEDDKLRVIAELPGVEKKDIKLDVTNDSLSISAGHKKELEEKGKNFYHKERSMQKFFRKIALPAEVLAGKAKAEFKNGTLEISLPKKEPTKKEEKHSIKIE